MEAATEAQAMMAVMVQTERGGLRKAALEAQAAAAEAQAMMAAMAQTEGGGL